MTTIANVRSQMVHQRQLINSFREVDAEMKQALMRQEALFAFLHREARARAVSGRLVQEIAVRELSDQNLLERDLTPKG